jgi:hypothetical protein
MPDEITFDDCCRIILQDWRWRQDSIVPELLHYKRELLALLNEEFDISWRDEGLGLPRDDALPALVSTMPRDYGRLAYLIHSAGWNRNWHRYNNEYGHACLLAGKTAVQALSGRRKGLIGRAWRGQPPHRSRRAQDQRADQSAKQGRVGTVGGERQPDPARGFLDPHRDLQQP